MMDTHSRRVIGVKRCSGLVMDHARWHVHGQYKLLDITMVLNRYSQTIFTFVGSHGVGIEPWTVPRSDHGCQGAKLLLFCIRVDSYTQTHIVKLIRQLNFCQGLPDTYPDSTAMIPQRWFHSDDYIAMNPLLSYHLNDPTSRVRQQWFHSNDSTAKITHQWFLSSGATSMAPQQWFHSDDSNSMIPQQWLHNNVSMPLIQQHWFHSSGSTVMRPQQSLHIYNSTVMLTQAVSQHISFNIYCLGPHAGVIYCNKLISMCMMIRRHARSVGLQTCTCDMVSWSKNTYYHCVCKRIRNT